MTAPRPGRRVDRRGPIDPGSRAFVLVAVLVIVGSALLIVTGVVFSVQADVAGATVAEEQTRARRLAWSALAVVMNRLDGQRDRILAGDLPRLDATYVLAEAADGRREVVRLLPVTPDGAVLAPEAGKLDLNTVDAETLAATELITPAEATDLVARRDAMPNRAFQSVAELMAIDGITPERLYGPLDAVRPMDETAGSEADLATRVGARLAGSRPRGLADLVTVFAYEPAIQTSGRRRINLNVPWSEELGRRLDERFGGGAGSAVKQLADGGTRFDGEGRLFQVLRFFGVEIEEWPEIVDALTADPGDHHFGRLDINTASLAALAALPGLTREQAAQIVDARDGLSAERRSTIVWPALEGIVEPAAYETLAGTITTRSWTFRLRLAAGHLDADADEDGPLRDPVILEAVVDLGDPAPRVAYLRDITLLQTAAAPLAAADPAPPEADGDREEEDDLAVDATASSPPDPADEAALAGRPPASSGLDMRPLDMPSLELGPSADPPRAESGGSDPFAASSPAPGPAPAAAGPPRRRVGRWHRGGA